MSTTTQDEGAWVVIVDGEMEHKAETKEEAKKWAKAQGIDPDRIASVVETGWHMFL